MSMTAMIDDAPVARLPRAHGVPVVAVHILHDLDEAAPLWQRLQSGEIESPGQNLSFTRTWVAAQKVAREDQFYVVAEMEGEPVALLPLWRRKARGVTLLTWFPGPHVGCNAPLVNIGRLAGLGSVERSALWSAMLETLSGADLIYLKSVPQLTVDGADLFAELGRSVEAETLYRAQFSSWDEADKTQRSKSRRKHDRQQGERLDALGAVGFEELRNGPEARGILDVMFHQRAARFATMGVPDPFTCDGIREFYDSTVATDSGIDVRLHVLRLDGQIVAIRYNIAHGTRLFCLISSMSDDATIQTGSPGKQCLLRVMQTLFDAGYRTFDMGAGFTDEKRHWCNVQIPVRQHYVPLTTLGSVAGEGHRTWQVLRQRIKSNERLKGWAKALRSRLQGSFRNGQISGT
jgi:CelD/BcsL family acetyltransferase involved in cellulose biosynthesis